MPNRLPPGKLCPVCVAESVVSLRNSPLVAREGHAMTTRRFNFFRYLASAALAATAYFSNVDAAGSEGTQSYADPSGIIETVDINGRVTGQGPFFESLGINGRSCATCHVASQAMSISASNVQTRFAQTGGADPLFAAVDGANCPTARRGSPSDHSLLLQHGLIRVALPVPVGAPFTISVVHDPYGCAMLPNPDGGQPLVSVYRRPL